MKKVWETKEWQEILQWIEVANGPQYLQEFLYIMWDAGTGKSTLINHISRTHPTQRIAPTNTAALNIWGETFYKNFGIRPDLNYQNLLTEFHIYNSTTGNYLPNHTLIIDEVSMIDADNMDIIFLMHIYRSNRYEWKQRINSYINQFNTDQTFSIHDLAATIVNDDIIIIPPIIISGDFGQLPPVLKKDKLLYLKKQTYQSPYAFDSSIWKALKQKTVVLKYNYRQQNPDNDETEKEFVDVLWRIKYDQATEKDIEFLNKKVITPTVYNNLSPRPLLISTTNARVMRVNLSCLRSHVQQDGLPATERTITQSAKYHNWEKLSETDKNILKLNKWGERNYQNFIRAAKTHQTTTTSTHLKAGCQVMITGNDTREYQYANGMIWTLISVADDKKTAIVDIYIDNERQRTEIREQYLTITEQVYDKSRWRLMNVEIGKLRGLPLTLWYAITAHKSQGKSIEHLIIDPNDGMYEENQAYVAISRATNYKNLWFYRPIKKSDLKYNKYIIERMSNQLS